MKDRDLSAMRAHAGKTKEQLINELAETYRRIAEWERLETQRKQPEQEKATILNSMSELLIFQDLEHRVIWTNKAAGESVGLAPEQLVGHHCYKIWHKRSKPCIGCPVAKANETAKPQVGEVANPDGRTWFLRSYPMKDTGGNILGMVELVLDITDRKRMETKLRESEERYRCLVENALDGVSVYRDSILFVNDKLCKLLGYSKEELYGMKVATIIAPEDRKRVRRYITNRLAGRKAPAHYETKVLHKDGSIRHIEVAITRIIYKGQPAGQAVLRDITQRKRAEEGLKRHRERLEELVKERTAELTATNEQLQQEITQCKRAEEALRESEEKFRGMSASAQDGIIMMESEGNISYWNKAAQRIFGYTKKEAMGKEVHIFLGSKRYHEAYRKGFSRFKETGKGPVVGKTLELSAIRKDGLEFPIELSVSAVRVKGKWHAIGIVRDVTQRKQAEEALKESESKLRKQKMALEQKNIALREIVAQIEIEKNRIKEDIATNVNELLLPILTKLKMKEVSSKYVDLIKHHLQELASPFGRKITKKSVRLTPREIEICALIKGGLTSKETAKLLSLSCKTVEKHRKNIRGKLRIANKNVNLASFLHRL